jgi:hypothetical protein
MLILAGGACAGPGGSFAGPIECDEKNVLENIRDFSGLSDSARQFVTDQRIIAGDKEAAARWLIELFA